jgi:type II secretory pathway pseudopilin PulG
MSRWRGFTLVELNIAVIFVSLLLIATVATSIYIGRIYQKGVTLKNVNQTGRQLIDQFRRDAIAAPTDKVTVRYVPAAPSPTDNVRICFGTVSYVFNLAKTLQSPGAGVSVIKYSSSGNPPVIAARVSDNGALCDAATTTVDPAKATELLPTDSIPMAVHAVSFTQRTQFDEQAIWELKMTLGTNEKNTIDSNTTCKPPQSNQTNFDLCSVREFTTMIRTRGGT